MPAIDVVKWDGSPNSKLLAWKFGNAELATWSQLIVNESQEAFVVHGGVYDGPFGAGRHTLSTENIPLIRNLLQLPYGGKSPFTAEVWFVNRTTNLNVRWGTPDPIQLEDPKYRVMVPVRAFGQYGVRVVDSKKFLLKLVGTFKTFDLNTMSEYFRGAFITKIKTEIANSIIKAQVSVLEITAHLEQLSEMLRDALSAEMAEYGFELSQFNIHSISVPEDDAAVKNLKSALAKKAEMGILGFTYQQERSFDVMKTAAGNEGAAGGVVSAGMGLGLGVGLTRPMGQIASQLVTGAALNESAPNDAAVPIRNAKTLLSASEKVQLLKDLAELKDRGVLTDDEFQIEKLKILNA